MLTCIQQQAALFGPESGTTSGQGHIQTICDAFEIPHIDTRWKRDGYSINLSPSPRIIGKVKE